MHDKPQFAELYSRLADDELARIALSGHLLPEAQDALTVELQKRGLTDLSEYKSALEETVTPSSPGREFEFLQRMQQAFAEWMFAFFAWVFATSLPPLIWLAAPKHGTDARKACIVGTLIIVFSCFLGLKAHREGSHRGYVLKFILPLSLLLISTLVTLVALTSRVVSP